MIIIILKVTIAILLIFQESYAVKKACQIIYIYLRFFSPY